MKKNIASFSGNDFVRASEDMKKGGFRNVVAVKGLAKILSPIRTSLEFTKVRGIGDDTLEWFRSHGTTFTDDESDKNTPSQIPPSNEGLKENLSPPAWSPIRGPSSSELSDENETLRPPRAGVLSPAQRALQEVDGYGSMFPCFLWRC